MTVRWICRTCGEAIEEDGVGDHEADGHDVKAHVVPDRLLANDPWQLGHESTNDRSTDDE